MYLKSLSFSFTVIYAGQVALHNSRMGAALDAASKDELVQATIRTMVAHAGLLLCQLWQ